MRRGLKIFITLVSVGMVVGIILALALPVSRPEEERAQAAQEQSVQEGTAGSKEDSSEQPQSPSQDDGATQPGGQEATITPGGGGNGPGLTVTFPEPTGGAQQPPEGGYKDIYGQWITEMAGSMYGLKNCYFYLETNGNMSAPSNYDAVFEIGTSQFQWRNGNPAFNAELQVMLKLGDQDKIPVKIKLTGQVSQSFTKIEGTFSAIPQADAYAVYSQQGSFTMHR